MKTATELLRPGGKTIPAGFFSRRGEVLAPTAVTGFTMMGAILLSTLLSLWGIRLLALLTAGIGVLSAILAFLSHKGYKLPQLDFLALFMLAAALGLYLSGNERADLLEARGAFAGKEAEISGTVSEVVRREGGGSRFLLRDAEIVTEGQVGTGNVLFYSDGELSFDGGEKVILSAELSEELTLSQMGMGADLVAFRADYLGEQGTTFWHPLYGLRNDFLDWAQSRVYAVMPRESGDVMLGMLLGSREQLGSRVYALLQGSGLVHILSVSGLHIAVFFSLAQLVLRRAGKRIALLASIPLAGVYVFLTGASVPSVRSFVMISFLAVAEVLHRPKNTAASLGLAVTLFCLLDPMSMVQTGSILSIVAVWCLYAVAPAIQLPEGKATGVLRGGAVSLAVSAVTLPVMAMMSGYLPLLAPFCSILALPVMPAALALGAGCIIFGNCYIGRLLGAAADLVIQWIFFVSRLGSAGPKIPLGNGMIKLGCGAIAVLFILAALVIGIRKISQHRSLFTSMAAFLLAVTGLCAMVRPSDGLQLISLEGSFILRENAQALVIGSGRSDYTGQTVAQYLRASGVTSYTLFIPEGRMTFTGGSYELLTQFPAEQLIAAGNDSRLSAALTFSGTGDTFSAAGWSRWSCLDGGEMEVRPGEDGPYLIFTTSSGEQFVLQDSDDPSLYGGLFTVYYDQGAEGIAAQTLSGDVAPSLWDSLLAGEECPEWGAGFCSPDWTVYLSDGIRISGKLPEGGETNA